MRNLDRARCHGVALLLLLVAAGCDRTALDAVAGAGDTGVLAVGGSAGEGGTSGAGGTGGMEGTAEWGAPCTSNQDCRADAICCDGSTKSCDITRLPTGDRANPGQFVISASEQTVTDTITGLTWQRDGSGCGVSGPPCTWAAAKAYCASLSLDGVSGWRLPGRMELLTLVDFTQSPAIDPKSFPSILSNGFWTSSPKAGTDWAWYVALGSGSSAFADVELSQRALCTRGVRCVPKVRFAVLEGEFVQDRLTGLVWQRQGSSTGIALADAPAYCSTVGPGFRLPTVKELESLVDLTVTSRLMIDTTVFPLSPYASSLFWTSTPYLFRPADAWAMSFEYGSPVSEDRTFRLGVRCVR